MQLIFSSGVSCGRLCFSRNWSIESTCQIYVGSYLQYRFIVLLMSMGSTVIALFHLLIFVMYVSSFFVGLSLVDY